MPRTDPLTEIMKTELLRMLSNYWVALNSNATHIALEKHGYVVKRGSRVSGKTHWYLTESGVVKARQLKEAQDGKERQPRSRTK